MSATLIHGDCLEVLRTLDTNSVDSIVTDPPAGIGFMGKTWDKDKGGRDAWVAWLTEVMVEARRVLKPGGHALVWALPRTSHWTATALEDAGFDVRDCVVHLFGSGFPKSLDVGKAIDRAAGAEREVLGVRWTRATNELYGGGKGTNTETLETAPATPDAQRWDGWGTSLKPGAEHWWLVRKPFKGTVAANVIEHGTGALNIGACRVGTASTRRVNTAEMGYHGGNLAPIYETGSAAGRWPTNLVLTHSASCAEGQACEVDCPVGELDGQSGHLSSGGPSKRPYPDQKRSGEVYSPRGDGTVTGYPDAGGASRFYPVFRYQAKAPARERPKVNGIAHPTAKSLGLMRWLVRLITPPGGTVLDPFAGSGATLEAAVLEGFHVIGIEREADYIPLIQARLARVTAPSEGVHIPQPRRSPEESA